MKVATKKISKLNNQCSLCEAKFEVWLNNSRMDDERKERIKEHFLDYCPVCSKNG